MKEQEQANHEQDKVYTIIVNGREKEWVEKNITFEQVVVLAFGEISTNPNIAYTATYKKGHGHGEGVMVAGDDVKVKEGMIFNVTATDRS